MYSVVHITSKFQPLKYNPFGHSYITTLFFFLFIFSPCPVLLKKIKFFGCFQVLFLQIFLLSSEHVGNMVVHGPLLTGSLERDT